MPSMEALIGQFASLAHIKKVGEGTFGEAFKSDQVMLIRWFFLQPPLAILALSYPPVSSSWPHGISTRQGASSSRLLRLRATAIVR